MLKRKKSVGTKALHQDSQPSDNQSQIGHRKHHNETFDNRQGRGRDRRKAKSSKDRLLIKDWEKSSALETEEIAMAPCPAEGWKDDE